MRIAIVADAIAVVSCKVTLEGLDVRVITRRLF
jgi:hypothetical protein